MSLVFVTGGAGYVGSHAVKALAAAGYDVMVYDNLSAGHDAAIQRIEQKLLALGEREVDSRRIGEMVMEERRKLDKVAYIRFASVYRSFSDVDDFRDAIREVRD